jgi:hypothetical protein
MANYKAISAGNWSTLAIWQDDSGGSYSASSVLPGVADIVYANNFIVQVNQTVSVKSLRIESATNVTVGGRFEISTDVNVTTVDGIFGQNTTNGSGVYNPLNSCLLVKSACTTIITSDIYGGGATYRIGFGCNAAANVTIIGNLIGGTTTYCVGAIFTNGSSISITGNIEPGLGGALNYGLYSSSSCNLTIIGNINGSVSAVYYGVYLNGGNTLYHTGQINGNAGIGLYNQAASVIYINGIVTSSTQANAVHSANTTPVHFTGNAYNSSAGYNALHCRILFYNVTSTTTILTRLENCATLEGVAAIIKAMK